MAMTMVKGNKFIGAKQCYLALLAIEVANRNGHFFQKNKELKRWLAPQVLLRRDAEIVGTRNAKRIFWLLSVANSFIRRENGKIIITEEGKKFLWAVEFKRFEIFKDSKDIIDSKRQPRYKGRPTEIVGDGYQLIRYKSSGKKSNREFTKAGWISEFLHLKFGEKMGSASIAYLHAEQEGERHDHSKTEEIFIFTSGSGYMELGGKKIRISVNGNWAAIIEAGISHKLVPEWTIGKGRFLDAIVISLPGWESKNEYKIGESRVKNDGPVE